MPRWPNLTLEERFWAKVDRRGDDECWEWTAAIEKGKNGGYGLFGVSSTNIRRAHRVSWELVRGVIPASICVLHCCHNRRCVNPRHLKLGDKKQNTRDMDEAGRRAASGCEKNGRAVLTERKVITLRAIYAAGLFTQEQLAEIYGVSPRQVGRIVHERQWKLARSL